MQAKFHGHAVVSIETDNGTRLLIDPFIKDNEVCDLAVDTVEVDYIIVTHAHSDHFGDTIDIAQITSATVITTVEIANFLDTKGVSAHGMQPGGAYEFDFGTVKLTPAIHGSSMVIDDSGIPVTLGLATGVLITADEQTVYHMGDTALYSDMQLIGVHHEIDLAFIPIGDNFTMGPTDAALAAEWLQAKKVVPIHYNTFPVIEQNPEDFVTMLADGVGVVPQIGEPITF